MKDIQELKRIAALAQKEVDDAIALANRIQQGEKTAIAELIHQYDCHANHADGCGWFYESWDSPSYERKRYLERATHLLNNIAPFGIPKGSIGDIIKAVYGK